MSNCFKDFFEKTFGEVGTSNDIGNICYNGQNVLLHQPSDTEGILSVRKNDLEIQICKKKYPEYKAVEWDATVINHSEKESEIISDISVLNICIPIPEGELVIHRGINGDSCTGESYLPFENNVNCGDTISKKPYGGKSSHYEFPFFDICGHNDGLICGIGWSGTWFYEIIREKDCLILKAGLPDMHFYMEPLEALRLPRILLMVFEGQKVEAHNRFRRLMKNYFSPKIRFQKEMKMPIALQNMDRYFYCLPEWNTEAGQMKIIDFSEKCGYCDTFWLDAAWFAGGFPRGVGNYVFRQGFPEGLTNISHYAHEKGLRTMIWFEPERVFYNTQIEREHPEFLLRSPIVGEMDDYGGKLFDFSNPDAVLWMIQFIGNFIETYEIDIFRHDFNVYPDSFWEHKDKINRKGITEIKYIEGLYHFWDALLDRFPNLMIDCCASGGNRIDLETCCRCVFCWRSDTGCSPETETYKSSLWNQNQNLALSQYIVYHGIAAWDAVAYDVRSALSNGIAPNFDVFNRNCDFDYLKKVFEECSRLRKYWEEDFYPLTDADLMENHWSICQFGNRDNGVMIIFRREEDLQEQREISFQKLEPDGTYLLKISDEDYQIKETIVHGEKLLKGYVFRLKKPRTSLAVEYLRQ